MYILVLLFTLFIFIFIVVTIEFNVCYSILMLLISLRFRYKDGGGRNTAKILKSRKLHSEFEFRLKISDNVILRKNQHIANR